MSDIEPTKNEPVLPIETAPHDGTWFRALGRNGLNCKAHFLTVVGPSGIAVQALFSEFGALIQATSWLPLL
jgi:hypothetical protein